METAKFIKEITIIDPDTKDNVQLSIYKHEGGGIFAVDSSYLDQCHDDDTYPIILNPFGSVFEVSTVMLQD